MGVQGKRRHDTGQTRRVCVDAEQVPWANVLRGYVSVRLAVPSLLLQQLKLQGFIRWTWHRLQWDACASMFASSHPYWRD